MVDGDVHRSAHSNLIRYSYQDTVALPHEEGGQTRKRLQMVDDNLLSIEPDIIGHLPRICGRFFQFHFKADHLQQGRIGRKPLNERLGFPMHHAGEYRLCSGRGREIVEFDFQVVIFRFRNGNEPHIGPCKGFRFVVFFLRL